MRIRGGLLAFVLLLPAAEARAEWRIGAGFEHFRWTEDTPPLPVTESGPLLTLRMGATGSLVGQLRAEYGGRFYFGDVSYDGSFLYEPTVPVSGTTRYGGTTQQGRLRHPLAPDLDVAVGLDLDVWRRRLGPNQIEDYRIVSVRVGAEHDYTPSVPWRVGAGVKITASTHENAHFTRLGFDQNPPLRPGRSTTPYVDLGFAFTRHWSIAGSYDSFDFGVSNDVALTGQRSGVFYQPASEMKVLGVRLEYR